MSANDVIALDNTINESHAARAPERPADEYFEIFSAEQVLKDFALSDEEIESGRVGGPDDGGIDGFYFLINRALVADDSDIEPKKTTRVDLILIQATREAGFTEDRINKLYILTEDFLDLSRSIGNLKGTYNPALLAAIQRFKDTYKGILHVHHDMTVSYHYVSKGDAKTVNTALKKKVEQVKTRVTEWLSAAKCNFELIGAAELLAMARREAKRSYALPLSGSPVSPKNQKAFIGLVPITEYHKFLVDESGEIRSGLFAANVRDYQGNVKVNRAIQGTLEEGDEDEDFWWLNNGVTILASDASHSGTILKVDDPQIVNGLQTSRSIYNYLKVHPERMNDPRQVLVRIISVPKAESQDRIIKATNSQTAMPDYQLYATERFQMDIEAALKGFGLYYDRRKNLYKNQGRPISKIVSPLYLAQAVMSIVLQRPNDARASPSRVLQANRAKIFNKKYGLGVYTTSAQLMRRVDDFLKSAHLGIDKTDQSNLRFYLVMDLTCSLLKTATPKVKQIEKLKIPDDDPLFNASYDRVNYEYQQLGGTDQAAKGNVLVAALKKRLVKEL